ncbi:MAG TPA: DUF2730 family protein [Thermosulfurimonas dismutans]|uniref:DUF2730 family protein n=1 Tax=Thermosulfurimonas dismutans TaxID=999894 RepID=A0A7C3CKI7_9BACT|nr:DUF2730 family protein [Thermosulfurimonas dismutans]
MFNVFKYYDIFREKFGEEAAISLLRALSEIYESLAQTVTKEEFNELKEIVREQGENLKVLTQRVDQLTKDVRRLTGEMGRMKEEMREIRKQVGGLSITVGYTLENEAFKGLPELLKRDHGLEVVEPLRRTFVRDEKGRELEVNIYGAARKDGKKLVILGEAKAQLSKNDVDRFLRRKVKPLERVFPERFLVLVTHMVTSSEVEEYARKKGVALYYSYQF